MLDVVWGIFDEDGDGRLTKAEFMDVSAHAAECWCGGHAVIRYSKPVHRVALAGGAAMVSSVVSHRGSRVLVCSKNVVFALASCSQGVGGLGGARKRRVRNRKQKRGKGMEA